VHGKHLVSIIIPCCNEGLYLRQTLRSIGKAQAGTPYEIVVVDDGSTDGCCDFLGCGSPGVTFLRAPGLGVANARNYGAGAARGDLFCFCDAHVMVEDFWLDRLAQPLQAGAVEVVCPGIADPARPDVAGYGVTWGAGLQWRWLYEKPVTVKPVPLAPGGCMMVRQEVFEDLGGFEKGFRVFGYDDQEFSLKTWLFGYRIAVVPGVKVLHVFRKRHPYPVNWRDYNHNLLRLALLHFNQDRLGKVIEAVKTHRGFGEILAGLLFSDVWEQRRAYLARRRYNDDWFMERFGIDF